MNPYISEANVQDSCRMQSDGAMFLLNLCFVVVVFFLLDQLVREKRLIECGIQ